MVAQEASRLHVDAADSAVLFPADDGLREAFGLDGAHVAQDARGAFQDSLVGFVSDAGVVGPPHEILMPNGRPEQTPATRFGSPFMRPPRFRRVC